MTNVNTRLFVCGGACPNTWLHLIGDKEHITDGRKIENHTHGYIQIPGYVFSIVQLGNKVSKNW